MRLRSFLVLFQMFSTRVLLVLFFQYPFPLLDQLYLPRTFSVCLIVLVVRGGGTRLRSRPSLFTCRSPSPRPQHQTAAVRRGKAHAAQRSLCDTAQGERRSFFGSSSCRFCCHQAECKITKSCFTTFGETTTRTTTRVTTTSTSRLLQCCFQ